jgi:polysaccharide deacetylase family protein (PEP-CTERM system associated)
MANIHILTFDIEDWFLPWQPGALPADRWSGFENRVERNVENILKILGRHNQRATFFILGWVAEKYPSLVKKIAYAGHELGFHSYGHQHLWTMQPKELAGDFRRGLSAIESCLGTKVMFYRAPYFSFIRNTHWAFEIIAGQGFAASSSALAYSSLHGRRIPNEPFILKQNDTILHEFPLNRLHLGAYRLIFSGSGYFRVLPGGLLRALFRRSNYTNAYFHPRDFDRSIPYSNKLSLMRNLFNRVGAKSTEKKLHGLLDEIHFMTLGEAVEILTTNGHIFPVLKV